MFLIQIRVCFRGTLWFNILQVRSMQTARTPWFFCNHWFGMLCCFYKKCEGFYTVIPYLLLWILSFVKAWITYPPLFLKCTRRLGSPNHRLILNIFLLSYWGTGKYISHTLLETCDSSIVLGWDNFSYGFVYKRDWCLWSTDTSRYNVCCSCRFLASKWCFGSWLFCWGG